MKMRADWSKFPECQADHDCRTAVVEIEGQMVRVRLCSCECHHVPLGDADKQQKAQPQGVSE
jgi:hypothetical protein